MKNEIDADKKKAEDDLAALRKEIEADRKKAEEKHKEAKDLLKKVEGVLKGAALQLQDKNPQVRIKTAKQIGKLSDVPNAREILGEPLCQAMFDPLPEVRNAASESLELLDPKAHPHIITLMIGKDKSNAAFALGRLKGDAKSALPVLIATHQRFLAALPEKRLATDAFNCVDILTNIAPEDQRVVQIVLSGITNTTIAKRPSGTKKSGMTVGNPISFTRMASLRVLDRLTISDKEKTSVLLMALSDGQDAVSVLAAIGKIGQGASEAIPVLNSLKTGPPDDQIRAAATAALAMIQSKDQPEQKKKGKGL